MIPFSRRPRARKIVPLALMAAFALSAAGCGRRGDPEPPPDAAAVQKPVNGDPANPAAIHKKIVPITPPKTPFVLDPLL